MTLIRGRGKGGSKKGCGRAADEVLVEGVWWQLGHLHIEESKKNRCGINTNAVLFGYKKRIKMKSCHE